jgi:hypothetical protein
MLATAVADKLDEMDAVVAGSKNGDAAHSPIGGETVESSSEPDFASFDETADASIDLGGDDEIEIAVVEAPGEAEPESGDEAEAELDLDVDDAGSAETEDVEDDEDDGNSNL